MTLDGHESTASNWRSYSKEVYSRTTDLAGLDGTATHTREEDSQSHTTTQSARSVDLAGNSSTARRFSQEDARRRSNLNDQRHVTDGELARQIVFSEWREETFDAVSDESGAFEDGDPTGYVWARYSGSLHAERHVKNSTNTLQVGALPRSETITFDESHKLVAVTEQSTRSTAAPDYFTNAVTRRRDESSGFSHSSSTRFSVGDGGIALGGYYNTTSESKYLCDIVSVSIDKSSSGYGGAYEGTTRTTVHALDRSGSTDKGVYLPLTDGAKAGVKTSFHETDLDASANTQGEYGTNSDYAYYEWVPPDFPWLEGTWEKTSETLCPHLGNETHRTDKGRKDTRTFYGPGVATVKNSGRRLETYTIAATYPHIGSGVDPDPQPYVYSEQGTIVRVTDYATGQPTIAVNTHTVSNNPSITEYTSQEIATYLAGSPTAGLDPIAVAFSAALPAPAFVSQPTATLVAVAMSGTIDKAKGEGEDGGGWVGVGSTRPPGDYMVVGMVDGYGVQYLVDGSGPPVIYYREGFYYVPNAQYGILTRYRPGATVVSVEKYEGMWKRWDDSRHKSMAMRNASPYGAFIEELNCQVLVFPFRIALPDSEPSYRIRYSDGYEYSTMSPGPSQADLMAQGALVASGLRWPGRVPTPALKALPALRQRYVDAVRALAGKVPGMRKAGMSSEQIARSLHAERRALGELYKNVTDPALLEQIYQRNLTKYGDKLGPTIEWLRARGKTWEEIIESACRPGGADLGF
ncbi:MAG: hypothetical protein JW809_05530 [Pirellulales bacterium]|nr:hypothetical protein [Pirellulales bacterium]